MKELFVTIFKYRGVLFFRTVAGLRADASGLYLGYVWWLLEPVLNTALYYLIFGVVLGSKTPAFMGYLFIGTTIYQWFQTAVTGSMGTITARAHIYRQIPLPKYLFSLIGVFGATWRFVCVFAVVLVYVLVFGHATVSLWLLLIPVLVAVQLAMMLGMAAVLSILSAYIADLQTFMTVVFRAGLFLSGIFWNVEKVPEHLKLLFYMNPMACMIGAFRAVILHAQCPNLYHLGYVTGLALVFFQFATVLHRKVDLRVLKHIQA